MYPPNPNKNTVNRPQRINKLMIMVGTPMAMYEVNDIVDSAPKKSSEIPLSTSVGVLPLSLRKRWKHGHRWTTLFFPAAGGRSTTGRTFRCHRYWPKTARPGRGRPSADASGAAPSPRCPVRSRPPHRRRPTSSSSSSSATV